MSFSRAPGAPGSPATPRPIGAGRAARHWRPIADGVYVRRFPVFNVNCGLVIGDGQALLIDTRGSDKQARELAAEVRWVTSDPLVVVNTHHHFDHTFGNGEFAGGDIWGQERCALRLREDGPGVQKMLAESMPEVGEEYTSTQIVPPNRTFRDAVTIEVGGRPVRLIHAGRGHTDNDVAVVVPDVHVVFAGDLVEQGAAPSFEDSYPLDWPTTLRSLLDLMLGPVVPGHGDVVSRAFAEGQLADLSSLAELARRIRFDGGSVTDALPLSPFPPNAAREALRRAFAQLAGEL